MKKIFESSGAMPAGPLRRSLCEVSRQGFTLVELLTVIAVIGILAGVIMVGMSSARSRARLAAAQQTAQSIMPFVAECYVKNSAGTFTEPASETGGGTPCSDAANYPVLNGGNNGPTKSCYYSRLSSGRSAPNGTQSVASFSVWCEGAQKGFTCSAATTACQ